MNSNKCGNYEKMNILLTKQGRITRNWNINLNIYLILYLLVFIFDKDYIILQI